MENPISVYLVILFIFFNQNVYTQICYVIIGIIITNGLVLGGAIQVAQFNKIIVGGSKLKIIYRYLKMLVYRIKKYINNKIMIEDAARYLMKNTKNMFNTVME